MCAKPTYRDERAVVEYLVTRLEERLAGRHRNEILYTLPSDHCQLGVLVPWARTAEDSDDQPESDSPGTQTEPVAAGSEPAQRRVPSSAGPTTEHSSQQTPLEPFSVIEDAARRPPSSLGMAFALVASESEQIQLPLELSVKARFAFYTRHFPTYEEQRRELGSQATPENGPTRREVTMVEKCCRHLVEIEPVVFNVDFAGRANQHDGGVVQSALTAALTRLEADPTVRRRFAGNQVVPVAALSDEATYGRFLSGLGGSIELPPLRASLRLRAQPETDGRIRIDVYLCNDTPRDTERPANDQYRILADASLEVRIRRGTLVPAELLPVPEDYQYDRRVYAIGHNVSVSVSEDERTLRSQALAQFEQPRMTTSERICATYEDLANEPFEALTRIHEAMLSYAKGWRDDVIGRNSRRMSPDELDACGADLSAFEREIDSFACGAAALAADHRLELAFRHMNRAFSKGKYSQWRLFQIVFIVTQLPAIVAREGVDFGEWPKGQERRWNGILNRADVLWFPTGGGKTEAYLGLVSCAALYDRLRGKSFGVTAWLRFPLRMLSVQQLQRAMRVLWNTELERRVLAEHGGGGDAMGDPISLGYLVGKGNTPNAFRDQWSFENLKKDERLRERLLLISDCPACGSEGTINIFLDERRQRVEHRCTTCDTELPVYVSDDEVYRFLPSLVIGTVDKMAAIAYQPKVALLWSGPQWCCGVEGHGYGIGDWCVFGCPTNPNTQNPNGIRKRHVAPYDPSPSFHIQDELHLLQEELGAFAGHYETMVRNDEGAVSDQPSKVIAATATISGYEHQSRHIYGVRDVRRFPARGYDLVETFYTTAERIEQSPNSNAKAMRIFTAFRPPYLRAADAAALCAEILHESINELQSEPYAAAVRIGLQDASTEEEIRDLLSYYSRSLTYVGKRDSGSRIKDKLERDSSSKTLLKPTPDRELNVEYLESRSTLREIAETIKRAEAADLWTSDRYLDATVATDVISHGVDVDRFNLMVLERIPEQIAGYIQVSSRSGRQHVGLVVAVLPRQSLRASSIYDRFPEFHRHLDRMVAPVPVNRFAKTAVDRSFPGVLLGTLYGRHLPQIRGRRAQQRSLVAQAMRNPQAGPVTATQLFDELEHSYALGYGIYDPSLERQMHTRLLERFERFKKDVQNPAYQALSDVFDPKPMLSLRDVDVAVPFAPDPRDVDWHDLLWFQVRR